MRRGNDQTSFSRKTPTNELKIGNKWIRASWENSDSIWITIRMNLRLWSCFSSFNLRKFCIASFSMRPPLYFTMGSTSSCPENVAIARAHALVSTAVYADGPFSINLILVTFLAQMDAMRRIIIKALFTTSVQPIAILLDKDHLLAKTFVLQCPFQLIVDCCYGSSLPLSFRWMPSGL